MDVQKIIRVISIKTSNHNKSSLNASISCREVFFPCLIFRESPNKNSFFQFFILFINNVIILKILFLANLLIHFMINK